MIDKPTSQPASHQEKQQLEQGTREELWDSGVLNTLIAQTSFTIKTEDIYCDFELSLVKCFH